MADDGTQGGAQESLFYSFSLEDHVPKEHLLRGIDRFLDLSDLRQYLTPFYSHTGRPSIAPELMIRMLVIGYCFSIRSERRLCEEVHLNLAYRWFCHLDLQERVPDHSTFSKNRHGRFRQSDAFRHVFESVLRRCMKADRLPLYECFRPLRISRRLNSPSKSRRSMACARMRQLTRACIWQASTVY